MQKSIDDFIKGGLIITAKTFGIFFALNAGNVKSPVATIDIMRLAGGISGGVLAIYKKRISD